VIYVVQEAHGDQRAVKIGFTDRPMLERLEQLQSGNPRLLGVVAATFGGRLYEAELHERFFEHRANGEWFFLDGEVAAFVEAHPCWAIHADQFHLTVHMPDSASTDGVRCRIPLATRLSKSSHVLAADPPSFHAHVARCLACANTMGERLKRMPRP
jgi:hypothetical protein